MEGGTAIVKGDTGNVYGFPDMLMDFFRGMPTRGRTLFEMTVKNILYDKKTIIFFGLTFFLLVLPSYWAFTGADTDIDGLELFVMVTLMIYVQFLVLYACLLFASSLFAEEEEQRTMVYLISRPVSNSEIIIYKYLGFVVSVFIMFSIPLLINFGIIALKTPLADSLDFMYELGQFLGLLFMAIAAWGAFFMFLGIYFKKFALLVGLLYALFWETFMANIPTSIRLGTMNHYVRSLSPVYFTMGEDTSALESTPWEWALATLVVFALVMIIMTYMVLRKKDFH